MTPPPMLSDLSQVGTGSAGGFVIVGGGTSAARSSAAGGAAGWLSAGISTFAAAVALSGGGSAAAEACATTTPGAGVGGLTLSPAAHVGVAAPNPTTDRILTVSLALRFLVMR